MIINFKIKTCHRQKKKKRKLEESIPVFYPVSHHSKQELEIACHPSEGKKKQEVETKLNQIFAGLVK